MADSEGWVRSPLPLRRQRGTVVLLGGSSNLVEYVLLVHRYYGSSAGVALRNCMVGSRPNVPKPFLAAL
jgi:hypothetical protein